MDNENECFLKRQQTLKDANEQLNREKDSMEEKYRQLQSKSNLLNKSSVIEEIEQSGSDYDTNSCRMFAMNERIVAAESCCFASMVFYFLFYLLQLLYISYLFRF